MKKIILFMVLIVLLSGCNELYIRSPFATTPRAVLHPIDREDIVFIPQGARIEWDDMFIDGRDVPGDLVLIDRAGYFLSEKYVKQVMEVKVR